MLGEKILKKPVLSVLLIFVICLSVFCFEALQMRTDQTVWGENILSRIFGIALLFFLLRELFWTWDDIGFDFDEMGEGFNKGIKIAFLCFTFAYTFEFLFLAASGKQPHFEIFTGSRSLNGEVVRSAGVRAYIFCILFNIIMVWMEEGMFRGLFINLLERDRKFLTAGIISAVLYGIWQLVLPVRSFLDGEISGSVALLYAAGYLVIGVLMGTKWAMMREMDGNIWQAATDHLFCTLVVTNLLHVVSNTGAADEWLLVRLAIGQVISFFMILILYRKKDEPVAEKPRRFRRPSLFYEAEKEAKQPKKKKTQKRKK